MFKIGNWITYGLMFGMPSGGTTTHVKDVLFPKVVACRIEKWAATGKEYETGVLFYSILSSTNFASD